METLPGDILVNIVNNLDLKDKVMFKCTTKRFHGMTELSTDELLCVMLHDIISNVGNNYDITTSGIELARGVSISYILNVYINYAILFQKVRNHSGTTFYIKIMTLDRHKINQETLHQLVSTFQSYGPLTSHSIPLSNNRVASFFNVINGPVTNSS